MDLHGDQGRDFESRLMQEVLELLGVSKTRITPIHPHSDGMVEHYVKTVEKHLRKVVYTNQQDWDERLPSSNPRDHRRDTCQYGVWTGASPALLSDVWGSPKQRTVHDRLQPTLSNDCMTLTILPVST
jgi:transposase InsO family protein